MNVINIYIFIKSINLNRKKEERKRKGEEQNNWQVTIDNLELINNKMIIVNEFVNNWNSEWHWLFFCDVMAWSASLSPRRPLAADCVGAEWCSVCSVWGRAANWRLNGVLQATQSIKAEAQSLRQKGRQPARQPANTLTRTTAAANRKPGWHSTNSKATNE